MNFMIMNAEFIIINKKIIKSKLLRLIKKIEIELANIIDN